MHLSCLFSQYEKKVWQYLTIIVYLGLKIDRIYVWPKHKILLSRNIYLCISRVLEPNTRSNKNIYQIMLSLPKQLTLRCLSPPIGRRIPTLLLINFIFLNIYGQNLCWCSCPRITRGQAFVFLKNT